jgi:hypothetical protein
MKTLCERCIETLSRNLDMYDCLELLPEFIIEKILLRMKQFFQGRLGKLNDESVVGYLTMLHQQSCVTSLNLPWCNKITNDGCVNITQQLPSLCLRLTTINLSYCHNIDDSSIQVLAKACPALVGIDLTFTAVGDRGIGALVQHSHTSLERLSLEQCKNVTDEGIQTLARGFKRGRLTHLNIGGLSQITNVGIQILASHLKGLRMLSLSGCSCLIDFDIEDITKELVLLEELSLRCCWRLTDTAIRHVARMARKQHNNSGGSGHNSGRNGGNSGCFHEGKAREQRRKRVIEGGSASSARSGYGICLKRLDIGGCKRITSRGVVCVAKSALYLERLDLRGLGPNVTDETLGCIRGVLTCLKRINVQGCNCTLSGIDLMRDRGIAVVDGSGSGGGTCKISGNGIESASDESGTGSVNEGSVNEGSRSATKK